MQHNYYFPRIQDLNNLHILYDDYIYHLLTNPTPDKVDIFVVRYFSTMYDDIIFVYFEKYLHFIYNLIETILFKILGHFRQNF